MAPRGAVEVDGDVAARIGEYGGGGIAVYDADVARAEAGLKAALKALAALRHPEEPEDALVKFISSVKRAPGEGVGASLDAPDVGALDRHSLIVETLRRALEDAGVVGRLEPIDSTVLIEIVPDNAPRPWTGEVVPEWLPVPDGALDLRANFWEGSGFVEYWFPSSFDLVGFYRAALPPAGFEVGEESSTVRGQLPSGEVVKYCNLQFGGLGRECTLESGFRDRAALTGIELKVNIRCNLVEARRHR